MLYGDLSDVSNEYFIQLKPTSNYLNNGIKTQENSSFDWFHTFQINYSMLPESIISPSLATKIFFSGKVIKLIKKLKLNYDEKYEVKNNNNSDLNSSKKNQQFQSRNNLYLYFGLVSSNNDFDLKSKQKKNSIDLKTNTNDNTNDNELSDHEFENKEENKINDNDDNFDDDKKQEENENFENNLVENENKSESSIRQSILEQYTTSETLSSSILPSQDIFKLSEFIERIFNESLPHPSLASVSLKYLQLIREMYQKILLSWDLCLIREEIEKLIELIYSLSSNELWNQMIISNSGSNITIYQQLEFMRNTYLLGKGEFYQVNKLYLKFFNLFYLFRHYLIIFIF